MTGLWGRARSGDWPVVTGMAACLHDLADVHLHGSRCPVLMLVPPYTP